MLAKDIVNQLAKVLPRVTDIFSTTLAVDSVSNVGRTVTVGTIGKHGLVNGQGIIVSGTSQLYELATLTQADGIAQAETLADNDLTYGDPARPNVLISGANETDYNGIKPLLAVSNRRQFAFQVPISTTSPATGTIFLNDDFRSVFNGNVAVAVVDSTTFTYEVPDSLPEPQDGTINGDNMSIRTSARVARAVDIEKAIASYTEQPEGKAWCFVVLGDQVINRDRLIYSDAAQAVSKSDHIRMREIEPVELFVFIPTTQEISGADAKDLCSGEIKVAVLKSLFLFKVPSQTTDRVWSKLTPTENGTHGYNNAYYIHRFGFEQLIDLVVADGVEEDTDRAFRDINFSVSNSHGEIVWGADTNLDGAPLP